MRWGAPQNSGNFIRASPHLYTQIFLGRQGAKLLLGAWLDGFAIGNSGAGRRAGCAQPGAEVFLASKRRVLDDDVGACSGQSSVKRFRCPGSGTRASSPAFRAADRAPNSRDRCDHISTAEPVISCRSTVALKRSTIFGLACSPYPPGAYHEHADAVRRLLAKLTRGSLDRRSLAHSGGMSS